MGKKIAICGTAPYTFGEIPFNDRTWEIWGINAHYQNFPRWDKWFDIHQPEILKKQDNSVPGYWNWLKDNQDKLYLCHNNPDLPRANRIPWEDLKQVYRGYYTNSISLLIAYALEYEDPEVIAIYGVDMAVDSEYYHERPSVEYMIGIAEGKGVKVILPFGSEMLKTPYLYGIERPPVLIDFTDKKISELTQAFNEVGGQLENAQVQVNELNIQRNYLNGALDILKYFKTNWGALTDETNVLESINGNK